MYVCCAASTTLCKPTISRTRQLLFPESRLPMLRLQMSNLIRADKN